MSDRTDKIVELFASTADAFLQEFKQAMDDKRRIDIACSAARLAQLGKVMEQYFKGAAAGACQGEDDLVVANAAIKQAGKMLVERLEALMANTVMSVATAASEPAMTKKKTDVNLN